ncbi:hypothetical protein ABZ669_35540 [Streptomyces hirsutus]|uniref:hypothetical protein n=1 Tax=Streptomyces hirsutus TaxID=35620 RepID=UPI0033DA12C1
MRERPFGGRAGAPSGPRDSWGGRGVEVPGKSSRSALLLLGGDKAGNWERWYRDNIPLAERLYHEYTGDED